MSTFLDFLYIYRWSIPASVLMAGVLALVGGQWTARLKSAQIFVLGQGSSLGIVLGLAVNILIGTDIHFINLFLGFSLGWLTLLLSEKVIHDRSDRSHIYLTLFVVFLALTYLLTSLVPSLESHIATSYFGDIAVMSDTSAILCLAVAAVFGAFILRHWRLLSAVSFQQANSRLIHRHWQNVVFDLETLLLTTLAIQCMGYLYTVGTLFIGTSFAAQKSLNLKAYTLRVLFIAVTGTLLGFLLSLLSTNLPTVPCVILGQVVCGFLSYTKK